MLSKFIQIFHWKSLEREILLFFHLEIERAKVGDKKLTTEESKGWKQKSKRWAEITHVTRGCVLLTPLMPPPFKVGGNQQEQEEYSRD